jgi:hypothetical protein
MAAANAPAAARSGCSVIAATNSSVVSDALYLELAITGFLDLEADG